MRAPLVSDPDFCSRHASEIRALADMTDDDIARDRLLRIAGGYDTMAERAELRRAQGAMLQAG